MERLYYRGYWIETLATVSDDPRAVGRWSVVVRIGKDHPTEHVLLSTLAGYQSQREANILGVVRGKLLITDHIWQGSQILARLDNPFLRSWCTVDLAYPH